jgi:AcrR family transcriptional regulator
MPDAADTRRAILEAARERFMREGFGSVSTRDIATACGLTQPAIYHYFGSKTELYVQVLFDEIDHLSRAMRAAIDRERRPEPALRGAALAMLEVGDHDLELMHADVTRHLPSDVRTRVEAQFFERFVAPIAACCAPLMNADLPLSPVEAAFHFMAVVHHFGRLTAQPRPGIPIRPLPEYADLATRLFLRGISPPPRAA